jgi:hypothetical protein
LFVIGRSLCPAMRTLRVGRRCQGNAPGATAMAAPHRKNIDQKKRAAARRRNSNAKPPGRPIAPLIASG